MFVGVSHALAFVGVGLAETVQFGGDLTETLFVDAGQRQRELVLIDRGLGVDAFRLRLDAIGQRVLIGCEQPSAKTIFLPCTSAL